MDFAQYMANQTHKFDEMVLKDMTKPYLHVLRRDVRLLPNKLRRIWAWNPRRRCFLKKWQFTRRQLERERAGQMLRQRLDQWLSSLPKRRAIKERKVRTYSDFERGWIGKVQSEP